MEGVWVSIKKEKKKGKKKGGREERKGVAISDMRVEIGNGVFLLRAK